MNRYYDELKPYYKLQQTKAEPLKDDDTLVFESRFESGNL